MRKSLTTTYIRPNGSENTITKEIPEGLELMSDKHFREMFTKHMEEKGYKISNLKFNT